MDGVFIALAICCVLLGFERIWRLRDEPSTLTHRAILTALFSLGLAAAAYGTMALTAPFYNIGLAFWHALIGVLIGALEMMVLTLRAERVRPAAVRAVMLRAGLVTALLLATWPAGFAHAEPVYDLSALSERNPALIVHLVVFHVYIVWGLLRMIGLSWQRLSKDIRRRPTSTIAMLMVALGSGGFLWINIMIGAHLLTGRIGDWASILAPASIFTAFYVVGGVLLAVGEPVLEELTARYQLSRLTPLWTRVVELSVDDLHLPTADLPAPARLQRAYVEISDAICTLRIAADRQLDLESVASALRRGDVTTDPVAPTLSQALPPRSSRREDLEFIHALAKAFR